MEDKAVKAYLQQKLSGKTRLAAALDAIGIRLAMAFALYIWFLYLTRVPLLAGILAACVAGCLSLALSMHSRLKRGRRLEKYRAGIRRRCALEKLALMPEPKAGRLLLAAMKADGVGATGQVGKGLLGKRGGVRVYGELLPAHPETPLTAQDMAAVWRRAADARASICLLYSAGAMSDPAQSMAARLKRPRIEWRGEAALLEIGKRFGLWASDAQVDAVIRAEAAISKKSRRTLQKSALSKVRAGRYLLCGVVIAAASFVTGWQVYYLVAAGVCVALAALSLLKGGVAPTRRYGV